MNERLASDAKQKPCKHTDILDPLYTWDLAYVLRSFTLKKQNRQINLPDNATSNEDEKARSRDWTRPLVHKLRFWHCSSWLSDLCEPSSLSSRFLSLISGKYEVHLQSVIREVATPCPKELPSLICTLHHVNRLLCMAHSNWTRFDADSLWPLSSDSKQWRH